MQSRILPLVLGAAVALSVAAMAHAAQAATLDEVRARGVLHCGVSQGLPGFSSTDDDGEWAGIDVDMCRAVAAAVFGDAGKVRYTPLSTKERFAALQEGEIDILSRNSTWTMGRDTAMELNFPGIAYYDGQGFMVRKALGVNSALQLDGASICTNIDTTTELNVADYFRANDMQYDVVSFDDADKVVQAYDAGHCDVYTTDASGLYAQRLKLARPEEHLVLPEIISKEPLGPAVRQGDDQWYDIVKWSLFAMINAEELGVTSVNVDDMKKSGDPAIRRLLGADGDFGEALGLSNDWAANIVKQVGNYGEIFDANVGPATALGISRGQNALWTRGGLHYAPPIR